MNHTSIYYYLMILFIVPATSLIGDCGCGKKKNLPIDQTYYQFCIGGCSCEDGEGDESELPPIE